MSHVLQPIDHLRTQKSNSYRYIYRIDDRYEEMAGESSGVVWEIGGRLGCLNMGSDVSKMPQWPPRNRNDLIHYDGCSLVTIYQKHVTYYPLSPFAPLFSLQFEMQDHWSSLLYKALW